MSNQGDFGYRTRDGRSGLDPVDTRAETGRTSGFFISKVLFGRIRTHSSLAIGAMALVGVLLVLPLVLAFYELLQNGSFSTGGWVLILISAAFGAGFLVNAYKNWRAMFSNKRER